MTQIFYLLDLTPNKENDSDVDRDKNEEIR